MNLIKHKNIIKKKIYNIKLKKNINPIENNTVRKTKAKTTSPTVILVIIIIIPSIVFLIFLVALSTIPLQSVNAQQNVTTTTTNVSNLTINGKTFPIKYNITGGKLLGLVADNNKTTIVAIIGSPGDNAKLTIELPRNVIDSKAQGNVDTKYQIKIDNIGANYKEIENTPTVRILQIDFGKNDRAIEIAGTQMMGTSS